MKISSISFKTNYSQNPKRNNTTKPNLAKTNRQITFQRSLNIIDQEYDELMQKINNQIKPMVEIAQESFDKIAHIGLKLQDIKDYSNKKETDFIMHKVESSITETAPYQANCKQIKKYRDLFNNNNQRYNNIVRLSKFRIYEDKDLSVLIQQKKRIFEDNAETQKLKPLATYIDKKEAELENKMEEITLEQTNPLLFSALVKVNEHLLEATSAALATQYSNMKELLGEVDKLENAKNNKTISQYELFKRIERLNLQSDKILDTIESLSKFRPYIFDFVKKIPEVRTLIPTKADIEDTYANMYNQANRIIATTTKDIDKYYKENYEDKNIQIDFGKLKRTLIQQENALNEIEAEMLNAKQRYIQESNDWLND